MPWLPLFDHLPILFIQPFFLQIIEALHAQLPPHLSLAEIAAHTQSAAKQLNLLRDLCAEETRRHQAHLNGGAGPAAAQDEQEQISPEAWLNAFEEALHLAQINAAALLERLTAIRAELEKFVDEMDFGFLYNPQRRIFHIGYNLNSGMLDLNYYDLLASEARITSIVAIAKGDVPSAHWLYLSRPVTRVNGSNILLSWSGTMFEYLMPSQILRSYPGTLLAESVRGAVVQQIAYGKSKRVPWGISESGFYRFDASQNYQYRAFGVPGLGFKRGLSNDLVITPYASLMAVAIEPQAVINNLVELTKYKMFGAYGFYEALDFTSDRLPLDEKSAVVGEYMAHHQGMIMMALANYFCDDIMVKRMHSDPRIRSVELLLQEQISHAAPLRNPAAEDVKGVRRLQEVPENISPWQVPVQTSIPQMHLLSNGSYKVMISNMGGGYSAWRDVDLTRWQPDGVLDSWGTWIYLQEMDQDDKLPSRSGLLRINLFLAILPRCKSLILPIWPCSAVQKKGLI